MTVGTSSHPYNRVDRCDVSLLKALIDLPFIPYPPQDSHPDTEQQDCEGGGDGQEQEQMAPPRSPDSREHYALKPLAERLRWGFPEFGNGRI